MRAVPTMKDHERPRTLAAIEFPRARKDDAISEESMALSKRSENQQRKPGGKQPREGQNPFTRYHPNHTPLSEVYYYYYKCWCGCLVSSFIIFFATVLAPSWPKSKYWEKVRQHVFHNVFPVILSISRFCILLVVVFHEVNFCTSLGIPLLSESLSK